MLDLHDDHILIHDSSVDSVSPGPIRLPGFSSADSGSDSEFSDDIHASSVQLPKARTGSVFESPGEKSKNQRYTESSDPRPRLSALKLQLKVGRDSSVLNNANLATSHCQMKQDFRLTSCDSHTSSTVTNVLRDSVGTASAMNPDSDDHSEIVPSRVFSWSENVNHASQSSTVAIPESEFHTFRLALETRNTVANALSAGSPAHMNFNMNDFSMTAMVLGSGQNLNQTHSLSEYYGKNQGHYYTTVTLCTMNSNVRFDELVGPKDGRMRVAVRRLPLKVEQPLLKLEIPSPQKSLTLDNVDDPDSDNSDIEMPDFGAALASRL